MIFCRYIKWTYLIIKCKLIYEQKKIKIIIGNTSNNVRSNQFEFLLCNPILYIYRSSLLKCICIIICSNATGLFTQAYYYLHKVLEAWAWAPLGVGTPLYSCYTGSSTSWGLMRTRVRLWRGPYSSRDTSTEAVHLWGWHTSSRTHNSSGGKDQEEPLQDSPG